MTFEDKVRRDEWGVIDTQEKSLGGKEGASMDKTYLISYDQEADVLYFNLSKDRKGYAQEIDSGIYARYDAKTHELIGLTILNFSKKFSKEFKEIEVPASS